MHGLVLVSQRRYAEVSQHELGVLAVAEEKVAGLDVLMYDFQVVAVFESSSSLECQSPEGIHIAVDLELVERAALKVFHKLIVTMHAIDIQFSEVVRPDNHLEVDG